MERQPAGELCGFFSKFKQLSFKKGEIILHQDDEPPGIFYIINGFANLYSISKNAQQLTLIIYQPGDIFPLIWAVNDTPHFYYLEAMTTVELYRAPKEEFIRFLKNNNKALFEINTRVLERLGGVLRRMEHAMLGNAGSKVASIITICAERFGSENGKTCVIQIPLTHQDIARLIGMARETVSIEMKKLQKMGLIDYKGKYLLVKDCQKLKEELALGPLD